MAAWDVRLFGELSITRDQRVVDPPVGSKAQQLLAYLLIFRHRAHSREGLAGLLWGDVSTAQSKKYLRQALWQLRTALPSASGEALFTVGTDWVRIDVHACLQLDVASFERAFALTHTVSGGNLDTAQAAALRSAVDLYRGDLLDGCYWEWCLPERERLQSMYVAMLEKLMGWCEAQRRYEEGIAYGERVLRCDRAREGTHRHLMRLFDRSGERAAALRQYQRCAAALLEEIGVAPSVETQALHDELRAADFQHRPVAAAALRDDKRTALGEALDGLYEVSLALHNIERRVQSLIDVAETALGNKAAAAAVTRLPPRRAGTLHVAASETRRRDTEAG